MGEESRVNEEIYGEGATSSKSPLNNNIETYYFLKYRYMGKNFKQCHHIMGKAMLQLDIL